MTAALENALRWVVKAHKDDNTCEACEKNDGRLYRNRQAAYRDYPNGKGYKKCVGAKYGNSCRCRVTKRGREGKNVAKDMAALIDRARTLTAGLSAQATIPADVRSTGIALENALRTVPANAAGQRNALYIYNAIGGWDGIKAIDVATALAGLAGPLDVHLNSPGGFIFEGTAIYNAFKSYTGGPVTMWIDGYAASAASFIAMAASPPADGEGGIRIAANAFMMIHDGMGGAIGTAEDMRDVADLLDMLSDTIAETYALRAGGDAATWRETMQEGDTWYTATGAKEAGLADLVVGQEDEPVEPEPGEDEENASALFSLAELATLFQPTAVLPEPKDPTPGFDFEGLRSALKGVRP